MALLVLGARPEDGGPGEGLDTFESSNFPFTFSYPEDFRAASTENDVPALSLEGPNAITIQEIEPAVPESGLAAYVAQLLVEEGATARQVERSGIDMLTARIPRDVGGQPAESLLYFFSTRGRTFQLDCRYETEFRRRIVRACNRATRTIEFD